MSAAYILHGGAAVDARIEILALALPVAVWLIIVFGPRLLTWLAADEAEHQTERDGYGDEPV